MVDAGVDAAGRLARGRNCPMAAAFDSSVDVDIVTASLQRGDGVDGEHVIAIVAKQASGRRLAARLQAWSLSGCGCWLVAGWSLTRRCAAWTSIALTLLLELAHSEFTTSATSRQTDAIGSPRVVRTGCSLVS